MNLLTFSRSLSTDVIDIMSNLYDFTDLPRTRVFEIIKIFNNFLNNRSTKTFFNQILRRMNFLGETQGNIDAYRTSTLQKAFHNFKTEHACLEFLKKSGSYIPSQEIKIGEKEGFGNKNGVVIQRKKR